MSLTRHLSRFARGRTPPACASTRPVVAGLLGVHTVGEIDADIAFNIPYAGPFGQIAVLAGELAVHNALSGSQ
jgi:hypothetical protein